MADVSEENDKNNGGETEEKQRTKHKGKHDKDKPWDDPSIDHWKIEKFDPSWNESGMLEVSSFSTLFPQYRGSKMFTLSICLLQFLSFLMQLSGNCGQNALQAIIANINVPYAVASMNLLPFAFPINNSHMHEFM